MREMTILLGSKTQPKICDNINLEIQSNVKYKWKLLMKLINQLHKLKAWIFSSVSVLIYIYVKFVVVMYYANFHLATFLRFFMSTSFGAGVSHSALLTSILVSCTRYVVASCAPANFWQQPNCAFYFQFVWYSKELRISLSFVASLFVKQLSVLTLHFVQHAFHNVLLLKRKVSHLANLQDVK